MLKISSALKFSLFHPSPIHRLHFHQFYLFSSAAAKIHKPRSRNAERNSFTADYLINKFGFSRERAIIACKQVHFRSSEIPDSLIALFKKHGFSDAQISRIIRKSPLIFKLKPEGKLLPKIHFFHSLGISSTDTAAIITSGRSLLLRSLENQIIPSFEFIKSFVKSDEDTIDMIKRYPPILESNVRSTVPPNVATLRNAGVPDCKIQHAFKKHPKFLMIAPDNLRKSVERIKELGFNTFSSTFFTGLYIMKMPASLNWGKKMEVYKKWGYSETQVLVAFRKSPCCMGVSGDKIDRVMDYFINKMCDPSIFLGFPQIVSLSLEKTIVPRCSLYQVLKSKGLLRKKDPSLRRVLTMSKKSFMEDFVEKTPHLLEHFPQRLHPSK
ncbi:hypothetical protein F511_08977 [Dorcoceras hygrometricum]|uniref:Mitochondrial transcription termination factor family protein n=1 Tax=Dorcoceras hygrometricum TaxID=472368 RepID=A0A2Z7ARH6_9LAMI|nr:hypothetical protein F511_08977 [Dorcoceras hygrometricum]